MKKLFAVLLCMALMSTPVTASGEASGGSSDGAGPRSAAGTVAITVENGAVTRDEGIAVELADSGAISAEAVSGVAMDSTDNYAGGIAWYGADDFRLGGADDLFAVQTHYTGETLPFNSVLRFDLPEDYAWGVDAAGGFGLVAAGTGTMTVENVYVLTSGINR